MIPLAPKLQRRRSILDARAKIRAIDLLRADPNAQLGAGTTRRLQAGNPGVDPAGLLKGLAQTPDNPNLGRIRQQALQGWNLQGQNETGGYKAPNAMGPPPEAAPVATAGAAQPQNRRQELLGRTGDQAISPGLRTRILERIRRERARRV